MHATGLFFLRAAPEVRSLPDGTRAGLWLHVIERDPSNPRALLNELTARWSGAAAFDFLRDHGAELRAGRGLLLTMDQLRLDPAHGPIGRVASCELAPLAPSWIQHAERAAHEDHAEPADAAPADPTETTT